MAAQLDRDGRRLRRSSVVAGVGDGVAAVALPLLAASVTRDPLAVASVLAAQHIPWVLTAIVWRYIGGDRRTVIGSIDTVRALSLGFLGLLVLLGRETLLGIQLVAFVIGLGEALTDRSEQDAGHVSELSVAGMAGVAVVGLPLGGLLYEVFPATPFLANVLFFTVAGLSALLVGRPVTPASAPARREVDDEEPAPTPTTVSLAAALATFAASAVLGVLVLFALDDLALGAPAFGLLLAGLAAGALGGGLLAPSLGSAVGSKPAFAVTAAVAGGGHAAAALLADPARPWLAALALGVGTGAATAGAVLARALLQLTAGRPLTGPLLHRFHLAVWSAIPLGALVGGWLARAYGVADVVLWSAGVWVVSGAAALFVRQPERRTPEMV